MKDRILYLENSITLSKQIGQGTPYRRDQELNVPTGPIDLSKFPVRASEIIKITGNYNTRPLGGGS